VKPGRGPVLLIGGIGLWVAALAMLALTAQNSEQFGRLHPWILLINAIGATVLVALIFRKFTELLRAWRRHAPGSRMRARTVIMSSALAVAPILIVYAFSIQFLNRSIDSWFHVEVKQGLSDALVLSRAALDLRMREYVERSSRIADDLAGTTPLALYSKLDSHRRLAGAAELMVVGSGGRVDASSAAMPEISLPTAPEDGILVQARQGKPYVSLDPAAGGGYLIHTAVAIGGVQRLGEPRVLVAVYPVPERLAALADTVQAAYQQYGRLAYLRDPLKYSFTLTLTLVLLIALLAAIYGAFFFSGRLVKPIEDLIAGTRAVAKGDLSTRLELPSRDEMGYLVTSFNDMTKRLARAREETRQSQQAVEAERAGLAVILARLSTGVLSLEPDQRIRVANPAASAILGDDLVAAVGRPFDEVAAGASMTRQLYEAFQRHLAAGEPEWREQLRMRSDHGPREVMCACTTLPGEGGAPGGHVVVFDDITNLLEAQREAAWGEVARRLAHEIKNPLTPIQLSADRLRSKLSRVLAPPDAELLERATHTIVQQVESMKQMVNAFSDYARAPQMKIDPFDLNALVREVADLFRALDARVRIDMALAPEAATIHADRGRVRQILNNLLKNSLEALEGQPDARIAITTRRAPGQAIVEMLVSDNGPGFPEEMVDRVFDPYVTSKPKGTGLGLAIVRKIVEEHGGRIEAFNGPEGGARVRIGLPVDDAARLAAQARDTRRSELRTHSGQGA
jgi:nitrogen fixation/metabolism regulation signal transduction histidine kinase